VQGGTGTAAQGNRWQRIRGSNDAALSGWAGGRWIRESPDEVSSGECGLCVKCGVDDRCCRAVGKITVLLALPSLRKGAIPFGCLVIGLSALFKIVQNHPKSDQPNRPDRIFNFACVWFGSQIEWVGSIPLLCVGINPSLVLL